MNETLKKLERENIRLASFPKRVLAYIIDNLIISAIILLIFADELVGFDDITQIQMLMANFLGGSFALCKKMGLSCIRFCACGAVACACRMALQPCENQKALRLMG